MLPTKVVVIGAGSAIFGLNTLATLINNPRMRGSHLALVDLNAEALGNVKRLANRLNREWDAEMTITSHTRHAEALEGAQFVVISIEVSPREDLWKMDYHIPLKYGVRQPYAENGGPGGFMHAARNIGPLLAIAHDMERLCPDAWMLNFSNPLIRLCDAVNRHSKIKVVGLCHQLHMGYAVVAHMLRDVLDIRDSDDFVDATPISHVLRKALEGQPPARFVNTAATPSQIPFHFGLAKQAQEKIEIIAAGVNHFTWIVNIRDKRTGDDLLPLFKQRWDAYDPAFEPLTRRLFEHFGAFPVAGDEHICEYLPWVSDPITKPWEKYDIMLYEWDLWDSLRDVGAVNIAQMGEGQVSIDDLRDEDSEGVMELVVAMAGGEPHYHQAVNIPNDGYISNLPHNSIVEVPGLVSGLGVRGIGVGALPAGVAELCRRELVTAQLGVDAAAKGDRQLAMQCLLLDPIIRDMDVAKQILDDYLETYRQFLPQFWS